MADKGFHEIYVNTEINDNSDIAELITFTVVRMCRRTVNLQKRVQELRI